MILMIILFPLLVSSCSHSSDKGPGWMTRIQANWFHEPSAQSVLGDCYYEGYGVPQSYEKAAEYFQQAAEQGYAYAQYHLGICYENGYGVPQSYAKAAECYQQAAEQGDDGAIEALKRLGGR